MSLQNLVVIMAGLVMFMAWYANSSKRDKILCTIRRSNKTKISTWVKMQTNYLVYGKCRYRIIPSCIVFMWFRAGLIHMLFPQWVATLDFTEGSEYPLDPNTLVPVIISPELREVMNKEEWAKSYSKNMKPQDASKKSAGMLMQYLPWIGIIGVVLLGFYVYSNFQVIGQHLVAIENALKTVPK